MQDNSLCLADQPV